MQRFILLLSTVLLLGFVQTAHAQRSKMILGEWTYSEPIGKDKMDAKTQETMDAFFSTMWFSFKEDGTYTSAAMGKEETGTWTMDAEGKHITLTPTKGPAEELQVLDLSATVWMMELSPGKGFRMVHGARKTE
ncbi:MAG TPA: amylo-alpha-1,6-glucosidase [Flavobacteriales bacterium]|jgi:hypothetical protein|nr:amylo-alpha-1,6-glucosidase [Flavobacteriales bacterium]